MPTSKMHLNTSTFTRAMWKQQNKCPDAHFCNKKLLKKAPVVSVKQIYVWD